MSGTAVAYAPTRFLWDARYCSSICSYASAMKCPVLTWRMGRAPAACCLTSGLRTWPLSPPASP
eukprot:211495-Rhodomonas_salina.1